MREAGDLDIIFFEKLRRKYSLHSKKRGVKKFWRSPWTSYVLHFDEKTLVAAAIARLRLDGAKVWPIKASETLTEQLRIKMEILVKTCLVCFLTVFILTVTTVKAAPKIRASKGNEPSNDVINGNSRVMSCYESIPCGWALYSTERRQPFRRISTYTRNRL